MLPGSIEKDQQQEMGQDNSLVEGTIVTTEKNIACAYFDVWFICLSGYANQVLNNFHLSSWRLLFSSN